MIIAGTGHRPNKIGGYAQEAQDKITTIAQTALSNAVITSRSTDNTIISGMALGWDTALALAAMSLRIPFIAAIPFKGQEKAWPPDSQQMYEFLLSKATEVVTVCEGGYEAWKMQKRNEYMVDRADMILALWDGTSGGTCNCIKYAQSVQKPITNVWGDYLTMIEQYK